jgi:hypothetical protein
MHRGRFRTNVLISKLVGETNSLRLVFDRAAIHNGVFKLIFDSAVNGVTLRNVSMMFSSHIGHVGFLTKSSTVLPEARSTTGAV